jgi:hypothetical protein
MIGGVARFLASHVEGPIPKKAYDEAEATDRFS